MAVRFIDGFEGYGSTNGNNPVGMQTKYQNCSLDSTLTVQAGRTGGHCIRVINAKFFAPPPIGNQSTIIIGFGFQVASFTAAQQDLIYFLDNGSKEVTVTINTDGKLKVYKGSSGGTLLGTTSSPVVVNTWVYVEIKVKFHGSTGTVDIHFDGSSVLSLTGQNTDQTLNAQASQVMFLGSSNNADLTQFDDLYICDTSGSINTGILGPQKIVLIQPASDNGTNQFTTNSGSTHFNRVSDEPHDSDSTYLEDATSGHQELFGYGSVAGLAGVTAIQMSTVTRLTDANQFNLKSSILSSGTSSDDTAQSVSGIDYQTKLRCVEADPHTSAAWTVPAVNAAAFGFKVG